MKTKHKHYLILATWALCWIIPIFFLNVNRTDDLEFHLNRILAVSENLRAGIFVPSIEGFMNNGYGYANGLFYPPLFLVFPALLHIIGVPILICSHLFFCGITLITAFIAYFATRRVCAHLFSELFISDPLFISRLSLLASAFYVANPYRIFCIYARGAMAEVLAFVFIPLVIAGAVSIFYPNKTNSDPHAKSTTPWLLVVGMTGLLYSHFITGFLAVVGIALCCLFYIRKLPSTFKPLLLAVCYTFLLSSASLLPMLEQFSHGSFWLNEKNPFGTLADNAYIIGESSQPIIAIMLLSLGGTYLYLKRHHRHFFALLALYIGSAAWLFSTTLFPLPIIEALFPIVQKIQFPWRVLSFGSWFLTFGLGYFILIYVHKFKHGVTISLLSILMCCALFNFQHISIRTSGSKQTASEYTPRNYHIGMGEYLPIELDFNGEKKPVDIVFPQVVKLLDGSHYSNTYMKSGTSFEFEFQDDSPQTFVIPLLHYYGYQASINNEPLQIKSDNGFVTIDTGTHTSGTIRVNYVNTPIQYISALIPLLTLSSICISHVKKRKSV